ncbi:MAG: PEP/pyruvate-binding domain-containing protein [Deltaproteobacteria bacterium]
MHFLDADLWAFELGPADTLDAREIAALLTQLASSAYFGDRLRFHPRSERQIQAAARAELSTVDAEELWRGVRYQPVTLGEATGRVRIVRGAIDPTSIRGDEILVVGETPDDLPPVRALVTAELQTPLAHVAVLSESRGTPNMALRGVIDDAAWLAFEGQVARLGVGARSFTLSPATPEALEAGSARSGAARALPPVDREALALVGLDALSLADVARAGTKAAQLAEVRRLGLPTADGFVVPMGHYLAHLTAHELDVRAATLRSEPGFSTDRAVRDRALAVLRERIAEAEPDPELLDELAARARALRSPRVILRSSTNAEDLPGWSGAGLYDSIAADATDRADLARALCAVWASVYTLRAFDERELAGVDHDAVAMAVLVQPFLAEVRAMGVVITENPHSSRRRGYLVDLEPRGSSVTATVDARPEEWLLYLHTAPELVSRSTLSEQTLLDGVSALRLRDQLTRLHDGMLARWRARDPSVEVTSVDAELALDAQRSAVFLQARPYVRRR